MVLPLPEQFLLRPANIIILELLPYNIAGILSVLLVQLPLSLYGILGSLVVMGACQLLCLELGCHLLVIICHYFYKFINYYNYQFVNFLIYNLYFFIK